MHISIPKCIYMCDIVLHIRNLIIFYFITCSEIKRAKIIQKVNPFSNKNLTNIMPNWFTSLGGFILTLQSVCTNTRITFQIQFNAFLLLLFFFGLVIPYSLPFPMPCLKKSCTAKIILRQKKKWHWSLSKRAASSWNVFLSIPRV